MPLSLWFWLYYNPEIYYQYIKTIVTDSHYKYLILLSNVYVLFIFYDIYILWQIYKPKFREHKYFFHFI